LDEAGDQSQRGGLAATGRTQQADQVAVRDMQRHIVDHRDGAVSLGQTPQLNRRHAHPPLSRRLPRLSLFDAYPFLAHDLFRKPVPIPDQVRDRLFRDHAPAASTVSSKLFNPARGAETSTDMLPGGCWFFHIFICASGILSQPNTSLMHGSMRRSSTKRLACEACFKCAKCEPWMRFCRIQT